MQEVLTSLEDRLDPAHTAVLVVDMQNDFCAEGGYIHKTRNPDMSGGGPLAGRIMDLVGAARETGAEIVWIQANYEPKYLSGPAQAKRLERGDVVCCAGGSWGWDFFGVEPKPEEIFIEKHTYSAFVGTDLDRLLRARGIKTLVVTGVATNVCVESTLRDGSLRGYYIVVPDDCVASHAQDLHDATLKNVQMFLGEVAPSPDIAAILSGKAGALRQAGE